MLALMDGVNVIQAGAVPNNCRIKCVLVLRTNKQMYAKDRGVCQVVASRTANLGSGVLNILL